MPVDQHVELFNNHLRVVRTPASAPEAPLGAERAPEGE